MIRPIDTQILHPQTPIIAGREQRSNNMPAQQQAQFGDLMQKEVEHKKETVVEAQNPENLKADKEASKQSEQGRQRRSKKRKKQADSKESQVPKNTGNRIDIRI